MALGFVEVSYLSIAAVVADQVLKLADVRLLGIETTGNQDLALRFEGDVASITIALAGAEAAARALGASAVVRGLTRPEPALNSMTQFPNVRNPLYGGRDQFLPTDHPLVESTMNNNALALGIIETQGLTAILEATDTMLKAAQVTLVGKEKIGAAYVTVIVKGEVAAVKAAVDAGAKAVGGLGKLVAAHVIARPHEDLLALLPK